MWLCPVSRPTLVLLGHAVYIIFGEPTSSVNQSSLSVPCTLVVLYYPLLMSCATWDSSLYSELEPSPFVAEGLRLHVFFLPSKSCQLNPKKTCWINNLCKNDDLAPLRSRSRYIRANFIRLSMDSYGIELFSALLAQIRPPPWRWNGWNNPGVAKPWTPMAESEGFSNFGIETKYLEPVGVPQWVWWFVGWMLFGDVNVGRCACFSLEVFFWLMGLCVNYFLIFFSCICSTSMTQVWKSHCWHVCLLNIMNYWTSRLSFMKGRCQMKPKKLKAWNKDESERIIYN